MLVDEHFVGSSGPCRECHLPMTIIAPDDLNETARGKLRSASLDPHPTRPYHQSGNSAGKSKHLQPLRVMLALTTVVIGLWVFAFAIERSRPTQITLSEQRSAGHAAGEMYGREFQRNRAHNQAFRAELSNRFYDGKFTYVPIVAAVCFTFTLFCGFSLQYIATYLLRRVGLLNDIDAIVLSKANSVELTLESTQQGTPV
jgi:hypothetical protein